MARLATRPESAARRKVTLSSQGGGSHVTSSAKDPTTLLRLEREARAKRRTRRRLAIVGSILVVIAVVITVRMLVSLSSGVPMWWRTVRRDDPGTIENARRVEDGVWNHLYSVRTGELTDGGVEWTVALKAADANAWLNARFPKWIANQWDNQTWPEELREVQVDFDESGIRVGIEIQGKYERRILWATVHPSIAEDGSLWMPASWVHVGRLGIPASFVLTADSAAGGPTSSYIPEKLRELPEAQGMMSAFAGSIPMVEDAVVSLGDGRQVRLVSLKTRGGWLEITCRTEPIRAVAKGSGGSGDETVLVIEGNVPQEAPVDGGEG